MDKTLIYEPSYQETILIDNNVGTLIISTFEETQAEFDKRMGEREPSTLEDYILIKRLGVGAQGTVWKAKRKYDGKIIALKILNIRPIQAAYNDAINEVTVLEKISEPQCNPYLACYYGHSYDPENKKFLIEMEFIEGITLDKYSHILYRQRKRKQLYSDLLKITKGVVTGLSFVHARGIIHNDIKPENIIIDKKGMPKLVDFGIACITRGEGSDICKHGKKKVDCCKGLSGTPKYTSPEMIKDGVRYPQSDIWSLGVTLYNSSAGGDFPFIYERAESLGDVLATTIKQTPQTLNIANRVLDAIVNQSLVKDPFKRITTEEILDLLNGSYNNDFFEV